jgi:hypothetical protein
MIYVVLKHSVHFAQHFLLCNNSFYIQKKEVKLQPVTASKQSFAKSEGFYITSAAQFDVDFAPLAASSSAHYPYSLQICAESGFGRFFSSCGILQQFKLVFNNNHLCLI